MSLDKRRANYIENAKKYFEYLIKDFGYDLIGIQQSENMDELTYENLKKDRMIVLSNEYHPIDDGFEVQMFRPSVSTVYYDGEMLMHRPKEDQDENQEYLSLLARQLRVKYNAVISGKSWDLTH